MIHSLFIDVNLFSFGLLLSIKSGVGCMLGGSLIFYLAGVVIAWWLARCQDVDYIYCQYLIN
jgi:hypothetical protein